MSCVVICCDLMCYKVMWWVLLRSDVMWSYRISIGWYVIWCERMFSDWLVPHLLASLGLDDVEPSQGPGPFRHTEHPAPTGASMATRAFTGLLSTNGGMEGGFTLADSGLENNDLRAREEWGGMYLHLGGFQSKVGMTFYQIPLLKNSFSILIGR